MTKAGILSLIAGFVVAVFTGVSKFMESQNFWVDLTISKLIGDNTTESFINFTDIVAIQAFLSYLMIELPFSIFLVGLGCLLLIVSFFLKNH